MEFQPVYLVDMGKLDVRVLCLGVLSFGDATGYEIRSAIRSALAPFQGASFGSIYPALAKAVAAGEAVPRDPTATVGLEKRVYGITEAGMASLRGALQAARGEETLRSDFLTALFFAHLLRPDDIDRLVDERLGDLRRQYQNLLRQQSSALTEGQRFCIRYNQIVTRAAIDFLSGEGRAIAAAAKRGAGREPD